MAFVPTLSILNALKTFLAALPHPDEAKAAAGEKLFERVELHENRKLKEALKDLTIIKQRVALIVPGGDSYQSVREGRATRCSRTTSLDILAADRAWTKGGHEAVMGGENNVGVIRMKDLVTAALVAECQLGLPYVVLTPTDGQMITVADEDVKDTPGRECWVAAFETPAGEETLYPLATWPAVPAP